MAVLRDASRQLRTFKSNLPQEFWTELKLRTGMNEELVTKGAKRGLMFRCGQCFWHWIPNRDEKTAKCPKCGAVQTVAAYPESEKGQEPTQAKARKSGKGCLVIFMIGGAIIGGIAGAVFMGASGAGFLALAGAVGGLMVGAERAGLW